MHVQPRDFIETREGLIFAVVDSQQEDHRVLCFLRYTRKDGALHKLGTEDANMLIKQDFPQFLLHSTRLAARLHGVPATAIQHHHCPRQRVQELLNRPPQDDMESKAVHWLGIMTRRGLDSPNLGITGSLLIGAQTANSDLDFVFYDRADFARARKILREAIADDELQALTPADWRAAWERRDCDLGFEDYLWHEQRKLNKGLCEGSKFDMTLTLNNAVMETGAAKKMGPIRFEAKVIDASESFDFPARYRLEHPEIGDVLCFTHTYCGQALTGETVEISGKLEATAGGTLRVIVGSTREARGEFIKVVRSV